ncbi:MAG: glycosyltransferase [Gammaproteobacteria bacterium]|nr:glycosyltransferase [Gammaproteobacteria bacterium]
MIIIPAYQPGIYLKRLVDGILSLEKIPILIVDDGSTLQESLDVLAALDGLNQIMVISHATNQGKGAALKTGLAFARKRQAPFVVTADADGQHLPTDIVKIYHRCALNPRFIIGVRQFSGAVPLRSRIGNRLTSLVFWAATQVRLSDTQSGLRAIPAELFDLFLGLLPTRYDFELSCLLHATRLGGIETIGIKTVYEPGNPTSHFRLLGDSMQIYAVFFRYSSVAASIAALDFLCYMILAALISPANAFLIVRSITIPVYFWAMRKMVFKARDRIVSQALGYGILAAANLAVAVFVLDRLALEGHAIHAAVYLIINIGLALINFSIMRFVIFVRAASGDGVFR